jgi:hypothetical protein
MLSLLSESRASISRSDSVPVQTTWDNTISVWIESAMASAGTAIIHPVNGHANLQIRPYPSTIDLCDISNYNPGSLSQPHVSLVYEFIGKFLLLPMIVL